MMQQNFPTWFKSLQTLFYALLAGQIMVAVILYATVPPPPALTGLDWTLFLLPVMAMQVGAAFFLSRKKILAARALRLLTEKLAAYRPAMILKWALFEGATLLALVVCFFVAAQPLLLVAAAIVVGILVTQAPTRERLVKDLELSMQEEIQLDDPALSIETP